MTYRLQALAGALLVASALGAPVSAAVLYDNGGTVSTASARPINFSNSYANSFTLAQDATVTGIVFQSTDFPGTTLTSVGWSITPAVDFVSSLSSAAITSAFLFAQSNGYRIDSNSFSVGSLSLAAGTYYLRLANAVTSTGSSAYWSTSNGPSQSYGNGFRYEASQAFQVIGTAAATGAVPEPASWAMMIAGFGLVGAALRRRQTTAVRFA